MQLKLFKLRFRRRLKRSQRQVEGIGVHAEAGLEQHFFKRLPKLGHVWKFMTTWVLLLVLLGGCVVVQTESLSSHFQTTQPVPGGTYTEGVLGTFTNANPIYATSEVDTTVSHLIFAGLLKYNESNQLVGDLANSWSVDSLGTTYTVHLRPNLTWQDGKPLTADDVVFTYQAIQNPDVQSPLLSSWQGITITKVNTYTVSFKLPNPLSSFPYSLTTGIVPQHLLSSLSMTELRSADFNTTHPVGAGPFSWSELQVANANLTTAQVEIALKPFAGYWLGMPRLAGFVVHTYADEQQLLNGFRHQDVNAMVGVNNLPTDLQNDNNVQKYNFIMTAATMVFFNTANGVLSDASIRHALVEGADTEAILRHLGYATKAVNEPILKGQLGYDPQYAQTTYNPARAESTLDQAGWLAGKHGLRSKNGQPLVFTMYVPDTPEYREVAAALQADWRAIGVVANVQLQSTQDFQNTLNSTDAAGTAHAYDAILYGISIGADPDVFVYWDSSQTDPRSARLNLSDYKSSAADSALEAGRTRLDPALRTIKYRPFLQAWQKDAPALGLYQPRFLYVTHAKVYGLDEHTINSDADRFENVENWMIHTAKVTD